jgi:hypothetical protein
MATESATAASNRPRPWLLVLLAIVGLAYVYTQFFSGPAAPGGVPSTPPRAQGQAAANGQVDPSELDVRIETLNQQAPPLDDRGRNPFRFEPKAPPPPPPGTFSAPKPVAPPPMVPTAPPRPAGPPRIGETLKFIGFVETASGKIGAFSIWDPQTRECRGIPMSARQGDVIDGRYRVVELGLESAVVEYLDGKGRERLPIDGQACVVK